jgi:hypothetical protein
MTDNILSIALTFALLIGGTVAIGSELIGSQRAAGPDGAVAMTTLPTVEVVGRRAVTTALAAETRAAEAPTLRTVQ